MGGRGGGTSFAAKNFLLDYYIWGPLKRQGQCKLPNLPVFEAVIKIEYENLLQNWDASCHVSNITEIQEGEAHTENNLRYVCEIIPDRLQ